MLPIAEIVPAWTLRTSSLSFWKCTFVLKPLVCLSLYGYSAGMHPRTWRESRNLTFRAVAGLLDESASPMSVLRYERGEREAPVSVALAYERASAGAVTAKDFADVRAAALEPSHPSAPGAASVSQPAIAKRSQKARSKSTTGREHSKRQTRSKVARVAATPSTAR